MRDIKIGGEVYNCNEQYMMAKKAELFNDFAAVDKIMRTFDPSGQKRLGRQVKNFDKDEWEVIARDVVYDANYAKFTQHKDLRKKLVDSEDKIIVEASPTDCIWGIGMSCDDPGIFKSKNWRGTNWLGEAIMKVREQLLIDAKAQEFLTTQGD
jgi:ribA/ribD-fused uncharacterized protein